MTLFYMLAKTGLGTCPDARLLRRVYTRPFLPVFSFHPLPSSHLDRILLQTFFSFLPIEVSMEPTAQMKAKVAKAPRVMTMGFL